MELKIIQSGVRFNRNIKEGIDMAYKSSNALTDRQTDRRIDSIQTLRFIAFLLIFLGHCFVIPKWLQFICGFNIHSFIRISFDIKE